MKGGIGMSTRTKVPTSAMTGARRRLKLLLAVMVVFMCWAAYTVFRQFGQLSDRSVQLRESEKLLTDAQTKSEALQQQINRLNDKEYIEEIARKDLGLGYPGEEPIHIEEDKP
jgi:cell division protein DivIC